MKKSGMILAELVIAIFICGIVLGVSIFMFRSNDVTKTPYIYSVLKNLPNVNKLAIEECYKRGLCTTLFELPASTETYCALLADIFVTTGTPYCNEESDAGDFTENFRITNGVSFYDLVQENWTEPNESYRKFIDIFIDTDGADNGDNEVGVDIFPIRIFSNGEVIPSYSDDYDFYAYEDDEFFTYRIILDRAQNNNNLDSRVRSVVDLNGKISGARKGDVFREKGSFLEAVCASNPGDLSAYFPDDDNLKCENNSQLDACDFTDEDNNPYFSDKSAFCAIEPVKPRGTGIFKMFGI